MFSRRTFLATTAGWTAAWAFSSPIAAAAALPVPAGNRLAFRIERNGEEIGSHALTFLPEGDQLTVRIAVDILVKFGPIPLFRYQHRATENWLKGEVASLESTTYDNGKKYTLTIERVAAGLQINPGQGEGYIAPPEALPATHWNRRQLAGPMINTQDGKLMRPVVTPEGEITLQTASGKQMTADRYVLTGDVQMETWYDTSPHWAGLQFKGDDGSDIKYVLNG